MACSSLPYQNSKDKESGKQLMQEDREAVLLFQRES
jgi:hypothetical protein